MIPQKKDAVVPLNRETEPPPDPPSMPGCFNLREGETNGTISKDNQISLTAVFWPTAATVGRRVILAPMTNPDEFLAFGMFTDDDSSYDPRVPLVAWGNESAHLEAFTRMTEDEVQVQWYSEVSSALQQYIDEYKDTHFPKSTAQALLVSLEQAPSNEENYAPASSQPAAA